jgi:hypothetical protein
MVWVSDGIDDEKREVLKAGERRVLCGQEIGNSWPCM